MKETNLEIIILYGPSRGQWNLPNTFRIYPTPSGFIQHLQNLSNTFRIYPTPSGFIQHLQDLPNTFRIFPTFSDVFQHFQIFSNTFIIHPPPSEKNGFGTSGPFWSFFLKSQDPENVDFDKNDFFGRKL